MRAIRAERRSVRRNPVRMLDFGHPPQELQLQVIAFNKSAIGNPLLCLRVNCVPAITVFVTDWLCYFLAFFFAYEKHAICAKLHKYAHRPCSETLTRKPVKRVTRLHRVPGIRPAFRSTWATKLRNHDNFRVNPRHIRDNLC